MFPRNYLSWKIHYDRLKQLVLEAKTPIAISKEGRVRTEEVLL